MKTPREILFARHQAATPKLDALRREVVAGLNHQDTRAKSRAATLGAQLDAAPELQTTWGAAFTPLQHCQPQNQSYRSFTFGHRSGLKAALRGSVKMCPTLAAWCLGRSNKLWLELVWPCRRIWTGLAAVWILIFIVNLSLRDNVSRATGKPARSGEMIMSLQAQQRWMNELMADSSAPPEADRPRNVAPKPRTEKIGTATV
jgi:hypothetical protein